MLHLQMLGRPRRGGQGGYKLAFHIRSISEQSVSMFSFVPLDLCISNSGEFAVRNTFPGSTRSCEPMKNPSERRRDHSEGNATDSIASSHFDLPRRRTLLPDGRKEYKGIPRCWILRWPSFLREIIRELLFHRLRLRVIL